MNRDQNAVAPDVIIGSAIIRIPEAFLDAVRGWQAGSLGGAPVYAGSSRDVIDFVVNPALANRVPADVVAAIAEARALIRSGELEVPRVAFVQTEPG
jgi:basic membrane lipoprotein Med (substrate-binding protein (PBP1-ABC) superfamily)